MVEMQKVIRTTPGYDRPMVNFRMKDSKNSKEWLKAFEFGFLILFSCTVHANTIDSKCGQQWQTGTLTVYNNSDHIDDNGQLPDYRQVTPKFRKNVPIAAVHEKFWQSYQYHYLQIQWKGKIINMQIWDLCSDKDCNNCCTRNASHFSQPGFLIDVELLTAKRLLSNKLTEKNARVKVQYRICQPFDPKPIAKLYGLSK